MKHRFIYYKSAFFVFLCSFSLYTQPNLEETLKTLKVKLDALTTQLTGIPASRKEDVWAEKAKQIKIEKLKALYINLNNILNIKWQDEKEKEISYNGSKTRDIQITDILNSYSELKSTVAIIEASVSKMFEKLNEDNLELLEIIYNQKDELIDGFRLILDLLKGKAEPQEKTLEKVKVQNLSNDLRDEINKDIIRPVEQPVILTLLNIVEALFSITTDALQNLPELTPQVIQDVKIRIAPQQTTWKQLQDDFESLLGSITRGISLSVKDVLGADWSQKTKTKFVPVEVRYTYYNTYMRKSQPIQGLAYLQTQGFDEQDLKFTHLVFDIIKLLQLKDNFENLLNQFKGGTMDQDVRGQWEKWIRDKGSKYLNVINNIVNKMSQVLTKFIKVTIDIPGFTKAMKEDPELKLVPEGIVSVILKGNLYLILAEIRAVTSQLKPLLEEAIKLEI